MEKKAFIFNIQHFSVHDGPGIRTLIFFKGCSLRCLWCANPEGISFHKQINYTKTKCVGCGACLDCPTGAVVHLEQEGFVINHALCTRCDVCVKKCIYDSKSVWGEWQDIDYLVKQIEKDRIFYETSGGGVTLSGGDPVLQNEAACELLKRCRELGINTAIETAGNYSSKMLMNIAPLCDTIFFDLKGWDPDIHRALTGGDAVHIRENLRRLDDWIGTREHKPNLIVRIPLLPEFNYRLFEFGSLGDYLKSMNNLTRVEIEPFHNFGSAKYEQLFRPYVFKGWPNKHEEDVSEYLKTLRETGLDARVVSW